MNRIHDYRLIYLPESLGFAAGGETSVDSAVNVATRSGAGVLETVAFRRYSLTRLLLLLLLRPSPWLLDHCCDVTLVGGYVVDQPIEKTKNK
jgi:hypothetical protein